MTDTTTPPAGADGQILLPLNPAWTAAVVAADGRFWLDTTAAALLHPTAHGMAFRAYDQEYVCQTATTLRGLVRVTAHIPVLLPPELPIKLEMRP